MVFVTGDKPHSCELCNKKFALACNLRAHMKTHEGEYKVSTIIINHQHHYRRHNRHHLYYDLHRFHHDDY